MNDYMNLMPDSIDPVLGQKIKIIILKTENGIVFIDDEMQIQWRGECSWANYGGKILNRVGHLEASCEFARRDSALYRRLKELIAEAIARLIDNDGEDACRTALDQAEYVIKLRNREYSRKWYYSSAFFISMPLGIFSIWTISSFNSESVTPTDTKLMLACSSIGALGALASIAIRTNDLELDANAGKWLHIIEASARIMVGVISSFLAVLLVRSGLVLEPLFDEDKRGYLLIALSVIAGAGERVLPNFIKSGESLLARIERKPQ